MSEGGLARRRTATAVLRDLSELFANVDAASQRIFDLIRELDALNVWAECGARSTAHALSWATGLSMPAAREHVRVAAALGELPAVDAAFGRGEISYSKVRAITRVATPDNEETLVDFARMGTAAHLDKICRQSVRVKKLREGEPAVDPEDRWFRCYGTETGMMRIELQVLPDEGQAILEALNAARNTILLREQRASAEAEPGGTDASAEAASTSPRPNNVDALLEIAEAFATSADPLRNPRDPSMRQEVLVTLGRSILDDGTFTATLADGTVLHPETLKRLCCDGGITPAVLEPDGTPLDVGRRTRAIPTRIKKALLLQYAGSCAFPGCTNRSWLEGHHLKSWLEGGETKLSNLCPLCRAHHRLLHEGGFTAAMESGELVFRKPDGSILVHAPPRPLQPPDAHELLMTRNADIGLEIDGDTGRTTWDGSHPDYDMCVDAVLGIEPERRLSNEQIADIVERYREQDRREREAGGWHM